MADFYGGFGGTKQALEDSDLHEEDVWAALTKASEISTSNSTSKKRKKLPAGSSSSAISQQAIPRSSTNQDSTTDWVAQHSSDPVDIPDWSKIMNSHQKFWDDSCEYSNHDDDDYTRNKIHRLKLDDGDDDDDDGDKMVPPHEYLAKKLASTQIASHSMCEGVGRTLKGRDLSKLRNAILTKTGFLE